MYVCVMRGEVEITLPSPTRNDLLLRGAQAAAMREELASLREEERSARLEERPHAPRSWLLLRCVGGRIGTRGT